MEVETFECQETMTEPLEASEEAIELIESLKLEGQMALVAPSTDGVKQQTRCPYRKIRKDEAFVYGVLCPGRHTVEKYQESPIPLRVLQILAHAKSLDLFSRFSIWAAEGQVKDPVLVAYTTENTWDADQFILARWGEELDSWPQLVKKAVDVWREKVRSQLRGILTKVTVDCDRVDEMTLQDALNTESPYYNGW